VNFSGGLHPVNTGATGARSPLRQRGTFWTPLWALSTMEWRGDRNVRSSPLCTVESCPLIGHGGVTRGAVDVSKDNRTPAGNLKRGSRSYDVVARIECRERSDPQATNPAFPRTIVAHAEGRDLRHQTRAL
jgi:hypothetical protein